MGGVNCFRFINGECVSKMSNGEKWQDYINKNVIACPKKFRFETTFVIDGISYICKDRGSAIVVTQDGKIWIDILTDKPKYKFGQEVKAILYDD